MSETNFTVVGSHGSLTVGLDGIITTYNTIDHMSDVSCDECSYAEAVEGSFFGLYGLITRFDVEEWARTYLTEQIADQTIDILDLGYWHGDEYEPPAEEWRREIKGKCINDQNTIY